MLRKARVQNDYAESYPVGRVPCIYIYIYIYIYDWGWRWWWWWRWWLNNSNNSNIVLKCTPPTHPSRILDTNRSIHRTLKCVLGSEKYIYIYIHLSFLCLLMTIMYQNNHLSNRVRYQFIDQGRGRQWRNLTNLDNNKSTSVDKMIVSLIIIYIYEKTRQKGNLNISKGECV